MKYPILSSPIKIGTVTLKNRTVMTAMGVAMANLDGTVNDKVIAYYEERAKGGVGLIIPEFTRVSEAGPGTLSQLSLTDDKHIEPMSQLVSAVHQHGAKIFIQLHHAGRQSYNVLVGGAPLVAPSAIPCGYCQQETRALELEEIPQVEEEFIQAARRAKAAGADGVELHCTHGYLLHQFLSPYANKRTDAYGGSVENRARIVCEIIRGIKNMCGSDYPVTARVTVEEFLEFVGKPGEGIHIQEAIQYCQMFEKAGIDALNISVGSYETVNTFIEPSSFAEGWRIDLVAAVKQAVSVPVFGNSVIRHPEFAEQLLEDGKVDMISMGRSFLADPEWVNKALSGRESQIRYCISCLRCVETFNTSAYTMKGTECSVNARMGRELEYPLPLTRDGKNRTVAIIGAGPAGLECACVLAERGFKPVIFEKEEEIGGQLRYAKVPPHKERIGWLIDYYKQELDRLGVEIFYGASVTEKTLCDMDAYAIIVATGSKPLVPGRIPGIHGSNVCTVGDILAKRRCPQNQKVCVIGSGMTGLETSEMLAEMGNQIKIIEMADSVAPGAYMGNVVDVTQRLQSHQAEILLQHKLVNITDHSVIVEKADGTQEELNTDLVVLSLGVVSENGLYEQLSRQFDNVYCLGDAKQIGRIANAVQDGRKLASTL